MAFRKTAATFVAVKHVGVVGMGLMGHGIAQLSAMNGFKVTAVDIDKAQLEKGVPGVCVGRKGGKRVSGGW